MSVLVVALLVTLDLYAFELIDYSDCISYFVLKSNGAAPLQPSLPTHSDGQLWQGRTRHDGLCWPQVRARTLDPRPYLTRPTPPQVFPLQTGPSQRRLHEISTQDVSYSFLLDRVRGLPRAYKRLHQGYGPT